ncbi:hypothetical protein B0H14DRAFT_2592458 [Mycena olivaceomarginata]|nr:hypothetical protein B0H14DRAFT_2592458 [Mycena olivaceomarginata]
MHNLALTYSSLEQFEEAEKLQAVVLDNWRKFLGDDHLLTLAILGDSSPIGCSNYANKMLGPSQMGVARYRGGRIEPLQIRLRSSSRYQEPREKEGVNLWRLLEVRDEDEPRNMWIGEDLVEKQAGQSQRTLFGRL